MKQLRFALLFAIVLMAGTASAWGTSFYGESCGTNGAGCGVGANIALGVIQCYVFNSTGDTSQNCQTTLAGYPTNMPATIDPTDLCFKYDSVTPGVGEVFSGVGLNTTERIYTETDHTLHIHHTVCADHLVPAANIGTGGGPQTYYIAVCTNGFPCNNADQGFSSYPGPTGSACSGSPKQCYFNIWTPLPVTQLPMKLDFTVLGHMHATQGHMAEVPILGLMKAGSFGSLSTLNSSFPNYTANGVAHANSQAPNGGNYYVSTGSAWTERPTKPAIYFTSIEAVDPSSGHHTCHGDSNGNHNPTTFRPQNTCGSSGGGGDIGMAVVPFYPGVIEQAATDYRNTNFDSGVSLYYLNLPDILAPPANPESNLNIEVYPCNSSCSQGATPPGTYTVNATPVLYTDQSSHQPAANSTLPVITFQITVDAAPSAADAPPTTFSADANELAYFRDAGASATRMCTNSGATYGMAWWTQTQKTWLWIPPSPGDFNEFYTWNYDNARVYHGAKDAFTKKMDGTAWPAFVSGGSYGSTYDNLIISANGSFWVAMNSGTAGSSAPSGSIGSQVTSGGVTFLNVGNSTYWESCIKAAQEPYLNITVLSGASGLSQFSLFTGGFDRTRQQTGDGSQKDGVTVSGLFQRAEIDAFCYNPSSSECQPDHAHYGGGFMGGAFSVFSQNAGRGVAYQLDADATFWRTVHQTGQDSLFTSDTNRKRAVVWMQNACINYLNFIQNQTTGAPASGLYADNAYPPTLPYMSGLCYEALIEWQNTEKELDPTNSLGLLDDRIDQAIRESTGYIWTNWWNQTCQHGQAVCNYSFTYDPKDVQVISGTGGGGTTNAFFNELTNMITDGFTHTYAKHGADPAWVLPDGTPYDVASDQMRAHGFDAYHCATSWFCTTFSDGLWLHPFAGGTGTPKQLGQNYKFGLGNSYYWRLGYRSPYKDDLSPDSNPCRDGSNGNLPCASGHVSAFAETFANYPVQIQPVGNNWSQLDPTDCVNGGCSGTTTTTAAVSAGTNVTVLVSAIAGMKAGGQFAIDTGANTDVTTVVSTSGQHTVVAAQLNHSHVSGVTASGSEFSGDAQSAVSQITSTCARVNFYTFKQGQRAQINYGTVANNCTTGSATTQDIGFPQLVAPPFSTLQVYLNQFSVCSLTPASNIYLQFQTTDKAGNVMANNCAPTSGGWQGGGLNFWTLGQVALIVSTTSLPNAAIGQVYNQTLTAAGGRPAYSWAVISGSLPPGLNLTASSGLISGTPLGTDTGTYSFRVQVTDSQNNTATANLSITVNTLAILTTQLPGAIANVLYQANLTASGGVQPYTWTRKIGFLPPGFNFVNNNNVGLISGITTTCANYPIVWQVTDSSTPTAQIQTASLPITVTGCPTSITVTTTTLPDGTIGVGYTAPALTAVGGFPPDTWGLAPGSNPLPDGLNMSSAGVISGLPSSPGVFSFTVQVTDSQGNTDTAQLSITIHATQLSIEPITLPDGMPQFPYPLQQFVADGGFGTVTWAVLSGSLPGGLSLSTDGKITGTVGSGVTPGTFSFIVQATDSQSDTAQISVQIVIETPVTISSPASGALPGGTVGTSYSQIFSGAGGTGPYACALTSGQVPGLSMNNLFPDPGCALTGVPTLSGSYSLTVRMTDANGFYTMPDVSYSIVISSGVVQPTAVGRGTTKGRGKIVVR